MLKRIASVLLSALTLCTLAVPALAAADEPAVIPTEYVPVSGKVLAVDREAGQVTIECADGSGEFVLNVDENTAIVNNETHKGMKFSSIKKGSLISAWHSQAVTRSLPPQSYAYAIIANVKETATPGFFVEAAQVTMDEQGNAVILNDVQDLYLTIEKNTRIPVLGKNDTLKPANIRAGQRFFAWYDVVALSFPGQTTVQNITALPYSYAGSVIVQDGKVFVNGKYAAKSVNYKNQTMVPVELVGKALGFAAEIDDREVTLTKGTDTIVFQAGKDTFNRNGEEIAITAPAMRSGRLQVGLDAIELLENYFTAEIVR